MPTSHRRLAIALLMLLSSSTANAIEPPERIASDECMSCHDGILAPKVMPRSSHPYGVRYDQAAATRSNLRQADLRSGLGGTIADDLLVEGRIECTTCHDSHERETSAWRRLRVTEDNEYARAALCRACHVVD